VNAIRLLGSTARRQSGLGETLVMANRGEMTDAARSAFRKALELDPNNPKASFFLALGLAQDGKTADALEAFKKMEKEAPADAPWLPAVHQQIAALGGTPATTETADGEAAAPGNPTPEEMAAAQDMSAGDRVAMIRGMVSRLDTRLREEPRNLEGWMRLVRSYMVLKEPDKAKDALSRALDVFPPDSENGKALVSLADGLGIPVKETTQ
jgi:cytochrome c-type biogenesis protein CcmH